MRRSMQCRWRFSTAMNSIPLFPFPPKGKPGQGWFPRRRTRDAPVQIAGTHRCSGSPARGVLTAISFLSLISLLTICRAQPIPPSISGGSAYVGLLCPGGSVARRYLIRPHTARHSLQVGDVSSCFGRSPKFSIPANIQSWPFSRFPPKGEAGGRMVPRAPHTRRASPNRWHASLQRLPRTRGHSEASATSPGANASAPLDNHDVPLATVFPRQLLQGPHRRIIVRHGRDALLASKWPIRLITELFIARSKPRLYAPTRRHALPRPRSQWP